MKYFYPDIGDAITIEVINTKEPFSGYWNDSERYALANVHRELALNPQHTLVDAGTGSGRLAIEFAPYFQEVLALEPDPERMEGARKNFVDAGISHIIPRQVSFEDADIPDGSCDLLLLSTPLTKRLEF